MAFTPEQIERTKQFTSGLRFAPDPQTGGQTVIDTGTPDIDKEPRVAVNDVAQPEPDVPTQPRANFGPPQDKLAAIATGIEEAQALANKLKAQQQSEQSTNEQSTGGQPTTKNTLQRAIDSFKSAFKRDPIDIEGIREDTGQDVAQEQFSQVNREFLELRQRHANELEALEKSPGMTLAQKEVAINNLQREQTREQANKAITLQAVTTNLQVANDLVDSFLSAEKEARTQEFEFQKTVLSAHESLFTAEQRVQQQLLNAEIDKEMKLLDNNLEKEGELMKNAARVSANGNPSLANQALEIFRTTGDFDEAFKTLSPGLQKPVDTVNNIETESPFIDAIAQALLENQTPHEAARSAAATAEKSGIQVDLKTLSQWVRQAEVLQQQIQESLPEEQPEEQKSNLVIDPITGTLIQRQPGLDDLTVSQQDTQNIGSTFNTPTPRTTNTQSEDAFFEDLFSF